ncbi:MAG: acyclic terpene utilization AtuA family protein [Planctomycetota bacterium]|nr:acyclic terpene utilization AtuA family protein [Planctomycetota bacterium]
MSTIRIGNGAGFWGDSPAAPKTLLKTGNLDYLTLEYLAEVTLSILAHQKKKNPQLGYVTEVPVVARQLAQLHTTGETVKLVTNGGGMNPHQCARKVAQELLDCNLPETRIGVSAGDDFLSRIPELQNAGETLENQDTGEPFALIQDRLASANAYLGAGGIVQALNQGASIVLTGRVADASLVTGPCIHEFGWSLDDLDNIAKATVAGHLIECGAQVTGGFFSDWNPDIRLTDIGYPIAEISDLGEVQITKPNGSGGIVSTQTCAEQLIYEIGDPKAYKTPDVIADFSNVRFDRVQDNLVRASGSSHQGRPDQLKASIAYHDGFMATGMITVVGPQAATKARSAAEAIFAKLKQDGITFAETNIEILGAGDSIPGIRLGAPDPWEVVLRVSARSPDRRSTDQLGREIAPLVTSGPPGVTGYTASKATSKPVVSFWPTLVSREWFTPCVTVKPADQWILKNE